MTVRSTFTKFATVATAFTALAGGAAFGQEKQKVKVRERREGPTAARYELAIEKKIYALNLYCSVPMASSHAYVDNKPQNGFILYKENGEWKAIWDERGKDDLFHPVDVPYKAVSAVLNGDRLCSNGKTTEQPNREEAERTLLSIAQSNSSKTLVIER